MNSNYLNATVRRKLLAISTSLAVLSVLHSGATLAQQQEKSMAQSEGSEFGLFISQWKEQKARGPLAPGLINEPLRPIDPWVLRLQLQAQQAMKAK